MIKHGHNRLVHPAPQCLSVTHLLNLSLLYDRRLGIQWLADTEPGVWINSQICCRLPSRFSLIGCDAPGPHVLNLRWWLQFREKCVRIRENCFSCQRFKHWTAWKLNILLSRNVCSGEVTSYFISFTHIRLDSPFNLCVSFHLVYRLASILPRWGLKFSNHRNGFLWWKTHNEGGWISIVGRMQLNKHYAAQTQWFGELFQEPISLGQMLEADKRLRSQGALLYSVSATSHERDSGKAMA